MYAASTPAGLTVVIPAYNDHDGLKKFLPKLLDAAKKHGWLIVVVNDGSTDVTAHLLQSYGRSISVVTHPVNRGYGAALKSGILAAKTYWVATMDADGQHRIEDLCLLASNLTVDVDAFVGIRTAESYAPFARRPGKWVLKRVANLLSDSKIPDINCGLRIFRKEIIIQFFSFVSDRFSFSTSCLVSLLQLGCHVRYVPIKIEKRIGKSSVKQLRDGMHTLMLIIRLIFLFKPLRILSPIGLGIASVGVVCLFIHFFIAKMTTSTILVCLTGGLIFLFSLLADQVSGMRRDFIVREIMHIRSMDKHPSFSENGNL